MSTEQIATSTEVNPYEQLSHADRLAALIALRDALEGHITDEKKQIADALSAVGGSLTVPSRFGGINFQPEKRAVVFDDDLLLDYVKTTAPENVESTTKKRIVLDEDELIELLERVAPEALVSETVESVPAWFRQELLTDATPIDEDTFVRSSTGEVIEWASFGRTTAAKVSFPASREQKVTKYRARQAVASHLGALAQEVTDGA